MESYKLEILHLKDKDRFRYLKCPFGPDYTSNDYLNFSDDPLMFELFLDLVHKHHPALGGRSSRLISGHNSLLERLERELASFCGQKSALFFSSGYQANLAILSILGDAHDIVFSDEYNHASIIDGLRLNKCKKEIYSHRNYEDLENRIIQYRKNYKNAFIVTESLFSMEGQKADLQKIENLCQKYDCKTYIDESHATGVYGAGLFQAHSIKKECILATMHTSTKALGSAGAWICCDEDVHQYIINKARAFICTTAASPLIALSTLSSLHLWNHIGQQRSQALKNKVKKFNQALNFNLSSAILPLYFNSLDSLKKAVTLLKEHNFYAHPITSPTVPLGKERIRFSLKALSNEDDDQRLIQLIKRML